MTRTDLNSEWAWTQIEAMADDSLQGANRARMQRAMHLDSSLRAAVARAKAVRGELRRSARPSVPNGLLGRLLDIPGGSAAGWHWFASPAKLWAGIAVAAAVVAVAALVTPRPVAGPEAADPRLAAIQEFELALRYMQKSAVITSEEVGAAVGEGLRDALIVSRNSVRNRETEQDTGG